MATVAPSTAGRVDVVEWPKPHEQLSARASVALTAGTFAQLNSSGEWILALADTAPHSAGIYFVPRTCVIGEALTGMKTCTVSGFTVSQAFEAALYLSDTGTLADTAGTVSVQVGRVIAGYANQAGAAHDKLIRIDCPN